MKKNLLFGFIAHFHSFLFSCSNKNYTANNFSEKTEDHKVVAILPAEVTFTGKQPKNLSLKILQKQKKEKASIFNMRY